MIKYTKWSKIEKESNKISEETKKLIIFNVLIIKVKESNQEIIEIYLTVFGKIMINSWNF